MVLPFLDSLLFPYEFKDLLITLYNEPFGILIINYLNLQINLGRLAWRSSFIFLPSVLYCTAHISYTCVKSIPKYFILIIAVMNGVICLISFFLYLLLVYRNTVVFCMLLFFPVTVIESFIKFNTVLEGFLEFSTYRLL